MSPDLNQDHLKLLQTLLWFRGEHYKKNYFGPFKITIPWSMKGLLEEEYRFGSSVKDRLLQIQGVEEICFGEALALEPIQ